MSFFRHLILFCLLADGRIWAASDHVEGEVLVEFRQNLASSQTRSLLARHALRSSRSFDFLAVKGHRAPVLIREKSRTTAELVAMLKADPEVAIVEPNYIRHVSGIKPDDSSFSLLWGLKNTGQNINFATTTSGVDIRFSEAWRLARPATGEIVIGIIDTGVDIHHPDLAAAIWTNSGEIPGNGIDDDANGRIDDVHGFDLENNTPEVADSGTHGTHVAGIAAAIGRNGIGVIGVGFGAKILPMKVSSDGEHISVAGALAAYNYALGLKMSGINIVALNASFGGSNFSFMELSAITALRDAGIILCAAAGNGGRDIDSAPEYPASYNLSNIISVAALNQTNGLASISNFGATLVDLAAPGENIYSTLPITEVLQNASVTVAEVTQAAQSLRYSGFIPPAGLSQPVMHCGFGNPGDFPAGVSGKIALISRGGSVTFVAKVTHAMSAGATAVIIYDNTADPLTTGGWELDKTHIWIPALRVTQASGQTILAQLPASGTIIPGTFLTPPYQFRDGSSMATPHVSGAVAFSALNFPNDSLPQRMARILDHVTPVPVLAGKMTTGGRLNLLGIVDTDSDGLPDWWEMEHFGNLVQSATDNPDADSFPNLQEFLTGTSPTDASSQLAFSAFGPAPGNLYSLTFPSVLDSSYRIESSPDLSTWSILSSPVVGTGGPLQVTDPAMLTSESRRFYRISLLPE